MSQQSKYTPFLEFNRNQWSELRKAVPLTLTEQDLAPLVSQNEELSLEEVKTIYLPLTRLINYYIDENLRRQTVLHKFLGIERPKVPYIVSIAGSVAVGKSTSARILQTLLSQWPETRKVDLITTDGFLYPLSILKEKNILHKKGFPVSYDTQKLISFISDIKSGKGNVKAPIYSHQSYDIIPNQYNVVDQPDILILEGLNVLQTGSHDPYHQTFVSDFVDFSIFVDAEEKLLKEWYINRFLHFRKSAFKDPNSYFHHYSELTETQARDMADQVWETINAVNLHENILPSRERANLILVKQANHEIDMVRLRK